MKKLFINPGHAPNGMPDPGACNTRLDIKECDVTFSISKYLQEIAQADGMLVELLQHDSPTYVANLANAWGADVFVSIHCNSFSSQSASGTETWFYPGSEKGKRIAACVQVALVDAFQRPNRGIKSNSSPWPNGIPILRLTKAPAILVELAFISNDEEAHLLSTQQKKWAQAIYDGLIKSFEN